MITAVNSEKIKLRSYDPSVDANRIREIVGAIWQGGGDALMEIQYGVIGGKPWTYWQARSVLEYIEAEGARSFVAQRDSLVVGFCSYLVDVERRLATVGYNGVAPEAQGAGIGSIMMAYVMERIREERMEYAVVIVADNDEHKAARRIYQKYGFKNLLSMHYMVQKL